MGARAGTARSKHDGSKRGGSSKAQSIHLNTRSEEPLVTKRKKAATNGDKHRSKRAYDDFNEAVGASSGEDEDGDELGGFDDFFDDLPTSGARPPAEAEEDEEEAGADGETAQEKRIRLAKAYLQKHAAQVGKKRRLQAEEEQDSDEEMDAAEMDRLNIASRLRNDLLTKQHRKSRDLASRLRAVFQSTLLASDAAPYESVYFPRLPQNISAACATLDGRYAFAATKDGSIIQYDLPTRSKQHVYPRLSPTKKGSSSNSKKQEAPKHGHTAGLLALAVSFDGKYLASAGLDKQICIWDIATKSHFHTFTQHRKAVTSLAFQQAAESYLLYSGSEDLTVKVWQVQEKSYVETLFGHQEAVSCVHTLAKERCLSAGTRDRSLRYWKVPEESQLVFRSGVKREGGSLESCVMLDEEHWIVGSDEGSISLYGPDKRKAVEVIQHAHKTAPSEEQVASAPFHQEVKEDLVVSLASVPYSNVFASGGHDGMVRLWALSSSPIARSAAAKEAKQEEESAEEEDEDDGEAQKPPKKEDSTTARAARQRRSGQRVELIGEIPMVGYINGLQFVGEDTLLIATSREHKRGRWYNVQGSVRNRLIAIKWKI